MKALIIDVRYNPGGMVTAVVQILDDILPEGTVVYTEDKNGNRQDLHFQAGIRIWTTRLRYWSMGRAPVRPRFWRVRSKIISTALWSERQPLEKELCRQSSRWRMGTQWSLRTAKYFTPNGNYIHGVGIEPDIELEYEYLDKDATSYDEAYDNQIQKAIEVLKDKIQ